MKQLLSLIVLWLLLIVGLGSYTVQQEQRFMTDMAFETARSFFELIVTTRQWNAEHGGVYVPVTETSQPNPYLKDDGFREVTLGDGRLFTKINPAYMTRQIADIAFKEKNIIFHITSLSPIRPENAPLDWEKHAMEGFEHGNKEYGNFTTGKGFRYMAPLYLKGSCMTCHSDHENHIGDLRGGISVTLPHIQKPSMFNPLTLFGLIGGTGLLIIVFGGLAFIRKQTNLALSNKKLFEALNKVKTLSGLIPICMYCKGIRDDQGYWKKLEEYIEDNSDAEFSHRICDSCMEKYYPEKK